jgi:glutamyl-tRNA synthetase/glutamyl-Q tRNA(Asp) synthetase
LTDRLLDSPSIRTVAARWQEVSPRLGTAITRLAPSPTGELHLGHVAHLQWLWAVAGVSGARVVVRMEDHDRSRCRTEFERSILDDLDWLGFVADPVSMASLRGVPPSPFRQSDHPSRYATAFDQLQDAGLLYGCTCTRGDLGAPDEMGERFYPGTCRGQPVVRAGRHVVRVMLPDEPTQVDDLLRGALDQHPLRDHGDPMIRDAQGQWSYQFCVVIDDMTDGVNLIVRGADLVASTGRQFLLARLLGRVSPFVTVHHPLLLDADGRKLSKRDGSSTIRSLREQGMTREQVVALAIR